METLFFPPLLKVDVPDHRNIASVQEKLPQCGFLLGLSCGSVRTAPFFCLFSFFYSIRSELVRKGTAYPRSVPLHVPFFSFPLQFLFCPTTVTPVLLSFFLRLPGSGPSLDHESMPALFYIVYLNVGVRRILEAG